MLRIEGDQAWVEKSGAPVSLLGIHQVKPGDYIFHHAGLALGRV